jgi:hypothetical protein
MNSHQKEDFMEDQALEDLELKINKILTLMDEYKKENQEQRKRNQE